MVLTIIRNPKSAVFSFTALQRDHYLEDDVDEHKTLEPRESSEPCIAKWRRTLYLGSAVSAAVLLVNLIMVLWASLRKSEHGQSVLLLSENCDRVKRLSTGVHLLINILSTLLLAASNFAMQCVSSPTRNDVDRSHSRNEWLDIGVPSARNLSRISGMRLFFWLCLVLSSAPLHLLYNSTVYSTFSVNAPSIYVANSSFTSLTNTEITAAAYPNLSPSALSDGLRLVEMANNMTHLAPQDCISAYFTDFLSKYNNVILVSQGFDGSEEPISSIGMQVVTSPSEYSPEPAYSWVCVSDRGYSPGVPLNEWPKFCSDVRSRVSSGQDWVVSGYKVDYCLVQKTIEQCSLEYSLPLAIVVLGANLAKAILICLVPLCLRDNPLLTVGDAVASFLQSPDSSTVGTCLLTRRMVSSETRCGVREQKYSILGKDSVYEPQPYIAKQKRWWSSLSKTRWASLCLMYTLSLAVSISLLGLGLCKMEITDGIWDSGLGTVQHNTIINDEHWPEELVPNVLIANAPQLIYSVLYVLSNGILTNMALAGEWNTFSEERKGLRVSTSPKENQRTSHFLSLPYRYGLPLIALSALTHWLISQSIFLVSANAYNKLRERDPYFDVIALGYSPLAIVISICVSILLPASLFLIGCRRFKTGMPIAGSCSLAIAAACHPRSKTDDEKLDIEYRLLKWGVEPSKPGDIGHCAFSDADVTAPEDGVFYQ